MSLNLWHHRRIFLTIGTWSGEVQITTFASVVEKPAYRSKPPPNLKSLKTFSHIASRIGIRVNGERQRAVTVSHSTICYHQVLV